MKTLPSDKNFVSNKGIFVYYTSSLTQLYYHFYLYIGLTTTCFGPACGPSSGCNFDLRSSYTMCGVIFMFVRVRAGERELVTILVSTISFLMYISVVMDYVTRRRTEQ